MQQRNLVAAAKEWMPSKLQGVRILGSGHALPKAGSPSTDSDTYLGHPRGWTEDQINLAELAARRALAAAGYVATDVGLPLLSEGERHRLLGNCLPCTALRDETADGVAPRGRSCHFR